MDVRYFRKLLGWSLFIFFILACASPFAPAPTPVPLPEARMKETLNASIAGTAAAAQTQTQTALPPTATPTLTFTPSKTPTPVTPSPTVWLYYSTPTFDQPIMQTYAAFTATAEYMESKGAINLGSDGFITAIPTELWTTKNQWRCSIRSRPHPVVEPGKKFTVFWTVANIGWEVWTSNTIDFVYDAGFQGIVRNIQDIPHTVGYGRTLTVSVTYIAPRKLGTFHSRYVIKVDATKRTEFCPLRLDFEVKWK